MVRWPIRFAIIMTLAALLATVLPTPTARAAPPPPVEADVQAWLDTQPGKLKAYRDGQRSAAQIVDGAVSYYGLSPRVLLALISPLLPRSALVVAVSVLPALSVPLLVMLVALIVRLRCADNRPVLL